MHFGTNAHQGCQHEGQDEPNLTLNLSLAFLVQSSAAQHEAMVEVDMLTKHHRRTESTSKSPNGSVLEHAWLDIERSKRCGVLHFLSVSTSSVACVTLPNQPWVANAKCVQCMSCNGTFLLVLLLVLLLDLKDISLVDPPWSWCTDPLKEVYITGSMR